MGKNEEKYEKAPKKCWKGENVQNDYVCYNTETFPRPEVLIRRKCYSLGGNSIGDRKRSLFLVA